MKKFGFTLAEILVSLGIIGVISALTMPTLFVNTSSAKIGPTLAKAVSAFEQANIMMLNDAEADSLTDANLNALGTHRTALNRYLKGADLPVNTDTYGYLSKDGIRYTINFDTTADNLVGVVLPSSNIPHQNGLGAVSININGNLPSGIVGSEEFLFTFWDDGSLRPMGGTNWNGNIDSGIVGAENWRSKCALNSTPPNDSKYCAGHIFENNLKVNYKL